MEGPSGTDDRVIRVADRRILAIVPAYNEEGAVGRVIEETRLHFPSVDVLVVYDGSTDGTADVARSRGAHLVRFPFNCGIGTTMQTGYLFALESGYDVAIQVDGDGQHDPAQLMRLLKPILDDTADVVIGSRFLSGDGYRSTAARRVGIAWLATLISRVTGQQITDPTSGFRAANRTAIAFFASEYPTDYPEPEVIVPLCRRGLRLVEVPVTMRQRQAGRSSITTLRSIYYMVKVTLAITVGLLRPSGRRRADD